ncbi:MAG: prephenate dehydrogenase/arogenate dehydrogenase family protein [Granulosicoccus sp.]|nr:prephenate dehydrogenase/arogenate dehydrogenase family protein [Granulosicoccus sp.]
MGLPNNICIAGLGMIGGSLAAALKERGFGGEVTALVRSPQTGERGCAMGLIDRYSTDANELIPAAGIIVLAVPMLSMRTQLQQIQGLVADDAVITDAGSVKLPFIEDARAVFGSLEQIVPGHPIAGREQTGVAAADASLFHQRRVLLTPVAETRRSAVELVSTLWKQAGAAVELLSADHHDRVLASTSHLPHVLAFALVDTLATQQEAEEIFRYAAGGFRDFTRIASSDPVMWRDVCLTNRDALLESMDALTRHVGVLRQAIEDGDAKRIESIFARAKHARDSYTKL